MRTIDLATGTPNLPDLLNLANEENVILRAADGREYVLARLTSSTERSHSCGRIRS